MSKGIGVLQKRITKELSQSLGKRLPWTEVKKRFPVAATQHSLHRAICSLRERGLIFDQYVRGRRYIALTFLGDTELLVLCDAAHAQLEAVARARGMPVPLLTETSSQREPRPSDQEVGA